MQVNTKPTTRPEGPAGANVPAGGRPSRRESMAGSDAEKASALRKMKLLALSLLVLMAVIFVVAFALQKQYPWLEYVRAAAEGGMVGALADWFAVTALFKYPMGLKIPHTAIIPQRKDQIGASLGEFVETNFLSEQVVQEKLASRGHRPQGRGLALRARRRRAGGQGRCRRHPRGLYRAQRRRRPGRDRGHGPPASARSAVGSPGGPGRRADLRRRPSPRLGGRARGPNRGLGAGQPGDGQPAGD